MSIEIWLGTEVSTIIPDPGWITSVLYVRLISIFPVTISFILSEFSLIRFSGNKKKAKDVYKNMTPLTGADIAETIFWAINRPPHVNINRIELMPLQQGFNFFAVSRSGKIK